MRRLAASRRRRLARLRRTAEPTLRLAVKPTPIGPASSRRRASISTAGRLARAPWRTNKNCERLVRRWRVGGGVKGRPGAGMPARSRRSKASLGRELLAALGAAARQHLLAAFGGHTGAETMAALPHEPARLIGPLGAHDVASIFLGQKLKARGLPQSLQGVKDQPVIARTAIKRTATAQREPKSRTGRLGFRRFIGAPFMGWSRPQGPGMVSRGRYPHPRPRCAGLPVNLLFDYSNDLWRARHEAGRWARQWKDDASR